MSLLMNGKDCRNCKMSFTVVHNHLPRRRCAKLSMWVRDNDYCDKGWKEKDDEEGR